MEKTELKSELENVIKYLNDDLTTVAHRLGVSVATVSRWRNGKSSPQPSHHQKLRALALTLGNNAHDADSLGRAVSEFTQIEGLETAILDALTGIRELFHSHSTFSSQQDCLDFVSDAFFAHVASIQSGGRGIDKHLLKEKEGHSQQLSKFILDVYRESAIYEDRTEQDRRNREIVEKIQDDEFAKRVIKLFGPTVGLVKQAHAYGRDDVLNSVFSRFICGSFVDEKEMGQYLTPPEIVRAMTKHSINSLGGEMRSKLTSLSNVDGAGIILDPSCGVGSFLGEAVQELSEVARSSLTHEDHQMWSKVLIGKNIIGIDKSRRMVQFARSNLFLFGAGRTKIYDGNGLSRTDYRFEKLKGSCSIILTNPPFGAQYSGMELDGFRMAIAGKRQLSAVDSEILFMERYVDWLAPGGILSSIVPDNILTGKGIYQKLRQYLLETCEVLSVVSLPPVTFAAAGTSTKTSILTLRKRYDSNSETTRETYFGVARAVGFEVSSRGGYRRRIPVKDNDLPTIFAELEQGTEKKLGSSLCLTSDHKRWDAPFNINVATATQVDRNNVVVQDVATLVDQRAHPKKRFEGQFPYIEISDIDIRTGWVRAKSISVDAAPSRARKIVKAGDVLVSTVRPERGAIGVVPTNLNGAICSTGIAILRPVNIPSQLLRKLLATPQILQQMESHNVGIAYPAISEKDLVNFILPITAKMIPQFSKVSKDVDDALNLVSDKLNCLDAALNYRG